MARNGLKAVEDAPASSELYDSLPQEQMDAWDRIGSKGYTPYRSKVGNLWFGRRSGTDDSGDDVGPAGTVIELETQVDERIASEQSAESDTVLDTDPGTGNGILPGMEQKISAQHKALAAAIIAYDKAKLARVDASAEETKTKKAMDALLKVHEADLLTDNDNNYKYYPVGSIRGILDKEEKYTTRTEHVGDEDQKKAA
jgi:hypothetical protein